MHSQSLLRKKQRDKNEPNNPVDLFRAVKRPFYVERGALGTVTFTYTHEAAAEVV